MSKRFKTPYDLPERKPGIIFPEETRAKQSFKDDCDINNLLKRYEKTGVLPHNVKGPGQYADISDVSDYQTACNIVIQARENFDALPSKLRARFHNSPEEFLAFTLDPANAEEMVNLGLAVKRPDEAVPEAPEASKEPVKKAPDKTPRTKSEE